MSALVQGLNAQLRKAAGIDLDLLKFLLKQRLVGFEVAGAPFFDTEETTEWFVEQLKKSKKYLEYGSGGSTYVAAKLGVRFIAVESDPYFLKSVQRKIRADGHARDVGQTYRYADIGLTEYVGYPLRPWRASERRVAKFRRYSDPPPECFEDGTLPDLVLVDGRFRVACALKALRMLQNERGWAIVVDDYVNRPHYHVIADFAESSRYVGGRVVVFNAPKKFDQAQLEQAIHRYETVPE